MVNAMTRVLISGASIAGPALAFWLRRAGWEAVVVERAPALRTGGQNIDIRGAAREVVRRMGIDGAVVAATTGEEGTEFVGRDGRVVAAFPAGTTDTGGATGEREILRGDLSEILVGQTLAGDRPVEYRFGDRITGLTEEGEQVLVAFEHAPDERFDLVVAADGIGSSTRDLVFGDEVEIRSLNLQITYGTIPRVDSDKPWWRWYNAPGGRSVTLRPDTHGTTRATLTRLTDGESRAGVQDRSSGELLTRLRTDFGDAGWQAERVLAGFEAADDLYSESIGQVFAPAWSRGGVALLGDAAWCAAPVSGMGTSLSLVGAYVLAGELATHEDPAAALAAYERVLRPYVDQAQKLPPGTPRLANPRTRVGIAAFQTGLRVAAALPSWVGEKVFAPSVDTFELKDYGLTG